MEQSFRNQFDECGKRAAGCLYRHELLIRIELLLGSSV